jgi:hypothetical protein
MSNTTRANRVLQRAGNMFLTNDIVKCLRAESSGKNCVMRTSGGHFGFPVGMLTQVHPVIARIFSGIRTSLTTT